MNRIAAALALLASLASGQVTGKAPDKPSCGLSGALPSRIARCALPLSKGGMGYEAKKVRNPAIDGNSVGDPLRSLNDKDVVWRLVSLTKDGAQAWLDEASGLAWTDSRRFTAGSTAEGICAEVKEHLKFPLALRVPEKAEFEAAEHDGVRSVLPGARGRVHFVAGGGGLYFDGDSGTVIPEAAAKKLGLPRAVLCVAKAAPAAKTK